MYILSIRKVSKCYKSRGKHLEQWMALFFFIRLINTYCNKTSFDTVFWQNFSTIMSDYGESSTLKFLLSSHVKVTDETVENLIGRDELTISQSPNDEDIIGSLTIDVQKSNIRNQKCLYVHQVENIVLFSILKYKSIWFLKVVKDKYTRNPVYHGLFGTPCKDNSLLEQRQYKDDSIQSEIIPILNLPRFFPSRKGGEKARQFQNWNYFW